MLDNFNWILFVFLSLSLAEFAIQIVISELSQWIRGVVALTTPYHSKLQVLSLIPFWHRLLGKWWLIATPLLLLFNTHKLMAHMLSCPYCTGFHLAWIANLLILGMPLLYALLLAPITLVFVAGLDKLHSY